MRGLSIIEIVVVIAVLASITAFIAYRFLNSVQERALEGAVDSVVATLEQARIQTIASRNKSQHGVHFSASAIVLFEGGVYDPSSPSNKFFLLNDEVEISSWVLGGGGDDVIFEQLSGKTSNTGTVTLRLKDRINRTKTVTIITSGIIEGS